MNAYLRCPYLFSENNRGVIILADSDNQSTKDCGIVSSDFVPEKLRNYFLTPIESARFTYSPDLGSFIANWLAERSLPVIAGTSGSTEVMLSRVLHLVNFSTEEIKTLLLAQTASMIAMGHHSFFECMLVADRFGYKLKNTDTMLDFYLQCIPNSIQNHPDFQHFIQSSEGAALLADVPNLWNDEENFSSSLSDSLSSSISKSR